MIELEPASKCEACQQWKPRVQMCANCSHSRAEHEIRERRVNREKTVYRGECMVNELQNGVLTRCDCQQFRNVDEESEQ